jgi:hypothetical protein
LLNFTVPTLGATVNWTLPSADASGPLCSNGSGVLSFGGCSSGGITIGTTTIANGTSGSVLYQNGASPTGTIGEIATNGSGNVVLTTSATLTGSAATKSSVLVDCASSAAFGAVGVGIQFPRSAMQQFNAGQPWDVVPGSPSDGGHYVPCVGRNSHGNLLVVTWGRLHAMTPEFFQRYNDENCAYLSFEMLKDGKSPEGFDQAALESDLRTL